MWQYVDVIKILPAFEECKILEDVKIKISSISGYSEKKALGILSKNA